MFAALKQRDVLLHHPYDSFATSVQRFIEQAADDPQVLAIKQTLYRTSGDSPIIDALIEAAEAGKQVLALVEIKARFDEQANIAWARRLEQHGCHVVYGLLGLKTHCKLSMVVRDEPDGLRRYAHIGTGNYNPKTARLYEDIGLLTANPIITEDVGRLFNHLSGNEPGDPVPAAAGRSARHPHRPARPDQQRDRQPRGRQAGRHQDQGQLPGRRDHHPTRSTAPRRPEFRSTSGCAASAPCGRVCPGLSENIRVRSILGRFLEHSRLFWFANDGAPSVGIGSADLMHRNLDRRVEVLASITNPAHIAEIERTVRHRLRQGHRVLEAAAGRHLDSRITVDASGEPLLDMQEYLINTTSRRRAAAK